MFIILHIEHIFLGGETNAEDYVLAFFKNDAKVGNAIVYLYNPHSFNVICSVTTPLITSGGISVVNYILTANASTSVTVNNAFFLDETGANLSRGSLNLFLSLRLANKVIIRRPWRLDKLIMVYEVNLVSEVSA